MKSNNMKIIAPIVSIAFAFSASVATADSTAKITDVHLCCKSCVTGVQKAVDSVPGSKAEVDQDARTVTLSGPDAATVQKAADALVAAGYFGKCSDGAVKLDGTTGAKGEKVQSLKVEGVHLCCPKCVKAVDRAVKSVDGVKEQTAVKGAKSFEVTGDFNDQEVFAALQKEGLTGKVSK
jgi:copper chaperone CopZ